VKYLHRRCASAKWLQPLEDENGIYLESGTIGVAVRRPEGQYTTEPVEMVPEFIQSLQHLQCKAAFTMSSDITNALFDQLSPLQTEVEVQPRGIRIPIVQSLEELALGRTGVTGKSYICLIKRERIALVWNDSVEGILNHGVDIEEKLLGLVRFSKCCRMLRAD
jgi:hypothetical protein